jgi:hypothetical protein
MKVDSMRPLSQTGLGSQSRQVGLVLTPPQAGPGLPPLPPTLPPFTSSPLTSSKI